MTFLASVALRPERRVGGGSESQKARPAERATIRARIQAQRNVLMPARRQEAEWIMELPRPLGAALLAQAEAFDNLAIPIGVATVEVIKQPAALIDHHN